MLGVIALLVAAYYALAAVSSLLIPLVVATVLGMIFHPIVKLLQGVGLPPGLGAALVMVGLLAITAAAIWMAVAGVIDQWALITHQVEQGWNEISSYLGARGLTLDKLKEVWDSVSSSEAGGVSGLVQSGFSSVAAFTVGSLIGAFLLFYLLKDWDTLRGWVGQHLGFPDDLGNGLIEDATTAIRRYFYGLTLASIPVAIAIGLVMWLLGLPLAGTVVLVTFVTSYVPYLGAIFSGAFTVLIAMGAGGLTQGLIMLGVVIFTQNVVQTVVQTKLTSDQLALHPIVNLGSTIVGATVAGLLGATLSAPIVATLISAHGRISDYYRSDDGESGRSGEPPENDDETA